MSERVEVGQVYKWDGHDLLYVVSGITKVEDGYHFVSLERIHGDTGSSHVFVEADENCMMSTASALKRHGAHKYGSSVPLSRSLSAAFAALWESMSSERGWRMRYVANAEEAVRGAPSSLDKQRLLAAFAWLVESKQFKDQHVWIQPEHFALGVICKLLRGDDCGHCDGVNESFYQDLVCSRYNAPAEAHEAPDGPWLGRRGARK